MATLKDIRKRITSVKNTQKITKAMKMVAAAKLRRAQMAVQAARPYAEQLRATLDSVAASDSNLSHPLMETRENPQRVGYLIFTSNRGLCGGFNSNLLRRIETHLAKIPSSIEVNLEIIGKKGRDFYRSRKRDPKEFFPQFADSMSFADAEQLAQRVINDYTEKHVDEYWIVYNQFKSALTQEITIEKLLPFGVEPSKEEKPDTNKNQMGYIYEPNQQELLNYIVPKTVATQLYRAHLESVASELGARMTAMDNATRNARDMISQLTLEYNRVRQAAITTELMDIVNGAESIK